MGVEGVGGGLVWVGIGFSVESGKRVLGRGDFRTFVILWKTCGCMSCMTTCILG